MSQFQIIGDTKLTQNLLDSIDPRSWSEAYTWTAMTSLTIKDQTDKAAFMAVFPRAQDYTFDDKLIVQKYCLWKSAQKQQMPTYMTMDAAATQGKAVTFLDESKAIIQSTPAVTVPLSRVPMGEPDLFQSQKGPIVRTGSDVLAASIGAMTRWTGSQVVWSMPIDTMAKRKFSYAHVDGIKPFLGEIPSGVSGAGAKGRMWTFMLMAALQKMPPGKYAQFSSNWVRAMFDFPYPAADVQLPQWAQGNFSLIEYEKKFYYRILYQKSAELGRFENAYRENDQYEVMAQQLVEFAAERQGDASGISMLSQSTASWGLVSKSQSELEQTVSLILGMKAECTLLFGYSRPEMERIRESVKILNPSIKVYEKVEPHLRVDISKQMSEIDKAGLFLIKMRTVIDTSLVATRTGKVKSYAEQEALNKMWSHVENACISPNIVVLTAALLPAHTIINAFSAGSGWNSVFFFSSKKELFKAQMEKEKGLVISSFKPIEQQACWARIIRGMNNSVSYWIVPPINRSFSYTALLSPVGASAKVTVSYVPDADDFDVQYDDAMQDSGQYGGEEDEDQGDGDEVQDAQVPVPPPQVKKRVVPAKVGFVPEAEAVSEF